MAKIIKAPNSEIFHIKAMVPYWDELTGDIHEKSPYRTLAVRPDMGLHELGILVLHAFDFDCDHLFGFYDIGRHYSQSKVGFEMPDMMPQEGDLWGFVYDDPNKARYNLVAYAVKDIFRRKGKKWTMLFDYGDEWQFRLTLLERVEIDINQRYPRVVESKYEAPEQYPNYNEEE